MESFHHDGVWWDPATPEVQWIGSLRFDPDEGATLVVTLPSAGSTPFVHLKSYPLLHGVTTAGKRITLIDCHERAATRSFGFVPSRVESIANTAVVGFHCDREDPMVTSARVTFQHLSDWWPGAGLKRDVTQGFSTVDVGYTRPTPLIVQEDDDWRVSVGPALKGTLGADGASLREVVQFVVDAKTPRPLSEFHPRISAFGDFLAIACGRLCSVDELVIVEAGQPGERGEGTVHAVPTYKRRERTVSLRVHSLLRFADLEGRAADVLSAWLRESDRLLEVRALYLLGVYGDGFITGKLLALTQAVEAFHRRFCPGDYMDPAAFHARVFTPLANAIPPGLDSSHVASIRSRLKFANEVSQSRRFSELVAEHTEALRALVDPPASLVRPIVDVRNAFTHFPYPSPEHERDSEEILRFNWFLQLLLECCFLKTMGFARDEIAAVAHRSETYRQLAASYFRRTASEPDGAEG